MLKIAGALCRNTEITFLNRSLLIIAVSIPYLKKFKNTCFTLDILREYKLVLVTLYYQHSIKHWSFVIRLAKIFFKLRY